MWKLNTKGRTLIRVWIEALHVAPTRQSIAEMEVEVEALMADDPTSHIQLFISSGSGHTPGEAVLPLNITLFDWIEDETTTTP